MSELGEDHYYTTGDAVNNDPYVYDNGVLIEHFGITNTSKLNEIEAQFSALSIEQLLKQSVSSVFNTTYHCYLHREIFILGLVSYVKSTFAWVIQFFKTIRQSRKI